MTSKIKIPKNLRLRYLTDTAESWNCRKILKKHRGYEDVIIQKNRGENKNGVDKK